jgi:preprotein translocase subunit SecG
MLHEKGPVRVLDAILLFLDIVSAGLLILFVLLHAGRGGGLSDMFGGVAGSSLAGSTVVEKNLDRLTVVVALVFTFTTVLLAIRLD